ncbi:MAG: TetR/AcrR family transcriptional regulator [Smithellaceae bacterium]
MGLLERREKEKDSRRMLILKSARTLFFARGFKNVTVDEIAKYSELGKGSIYLYFSSKEEIYSQILLNDIDKFHQHAFALLKKKKTAADSLLGFSSFYADVFLDDPELFRILMTFMLHTDQMNLSEKQYKNIIATMRQTIDIIGYIFKLGIDSKEFPSTIDIKYHQFALWGVLNGIITLHIFSGSENKRREKIHSTIKSTLQVYIKGLKQS